MAIFNSYVTNYQRVIATNIRILNNKNGRVMVIRMVDVPRRGGAVRWSQPVDLLGTTMIKVETMPTITILVII